MVGWHGGKECEASEGEFKEKSRAMERMKKSVMINETLTRGKA